MQIDATIPAGAATDPTLTLFGPDGTELDFDDDGGDNPLESRINVTLPTTGEYTIVVGVFGERYGPFTLTLSAQ